MNKRGNTLVEVIVSFVIISIITFAILGVYTSSKKITRKTNLKENIIVEVESIYNVFSSSPHEFLKNIQVIYPTAIVDGDENTDISVIKICYDGIYANSVEDSKNYFEIHLTKKTRELPKVGNTYTLDIIVWTNGEVNNMFQTFTRTLIDGAII